MAQRASSGLKLQNYEAGNSILSGGPGASHREIREKAAEWCSGIMMALVAALGGSGAVSCPMIERIDGYPLRHAN